MYKFQYILHIRDAELLRNNVQTPIWNEILTAIKPTVRHSRVRSPGKPIKPLIDRIKGSKPVSATMSVELTGLRRNSVPTAADGMFASGINGRFAINLSDHFLRHQPRAR